MARCAIAGTVARTARSSRRAKALRRTRGPLDLAVRLYASPGLRTGRRRLASRPDLETAANEAVLSRVAGPRRMAHPLAANRRRTFRRPTAGPGRAVGGTASR